MGKLDDLIAKAERESADEQQERRTAAQEEAKRLKAEALNRIKEIFERRISKEVLEELNPTYEVSGIGRVFKGTITLHAKGIDFVVEVSSLEHLGNTNGIWVNARDGKTFHESLYLDQSDFEQKVLLAMGRYFKQHNIK